jgi:magnesium chelatase family protein
VLYAFACAMHGVEGLLVRVETNSAPGSPSLTIIGLPDRSLNEAKERVRAALVHSGFFPPAGRLLLNLSPADVRKEGPSFDLPIALALLGAEGTLPGAALAGFVSIGELALDGNVRAAAGVLPMAIAAKRGGFARIIVPRANRDEAALVAGIRVYAVETLLDAVSVVLGNGEKHRVLGLSTENDEREADEDFADVRGQFAAKRALEIAAAGGHNLLMVGPPGCGKTMLARRMPSILPALGADESLDVTAIHSIAGLLGSVPRVVRKPPFRAPHATSSAISLVGGGGSGGSLPRPGEVTLASHGVLYLDEIAEIPRSTLEVLRGPLEDGSVTISRASGSCTFPARFALIASMNPCPCGERDESGSDCRCDDAAVERYRAKLSGPLLDRIDLHVRLARVPFDELAAAAPGEPSHAIRARVVAARERQRPRGVQNARLRGAALARHAALDEASAALLESATARSGLSARGYDRIRRVARSIADLAGTTAIRREHVAEALLYRRS